MRGTMFLQKLEAARTFSVLFEAEDLHCLGKMILSVPVDPHSLASRWALEKKGHPEPEMDPIQTYTCQFTSF